MKTVLTTVFGGSGFIGRHVVRQLVATGRRIRVAVRDPEAALYLKPFGEVGQVVPVQASLIKPDTVRTAVQGADEVINLVGVLHSRGRQTFANLHHQGAKLVAAAAKEADVQSLVHMSALGADLDSPSRYAQSKAAGEVAVRSAFPEASVLRPSLVFGPQDKFFNTFARLMQWSPVLPLIGGGRTQFQPVSVEDVAQVVVICLENSKQCGGQIYELGGAKTYSFEELLRLIMAQTGRHCGLVSMPFWLASFEAFFMEMLPMPLFTRDQVKLLQQDNVLSGDHPGLADLGIQPASLEQALPTYLKMYRKGSGG